MSKEEREGVGGDEREDGGGSLWFLEISQKFKLN